MTTNAVDIGTIWNIGAIEVQKVEAMDIDKGSATKKIEITVDSGAGASCWPASLLKKVPMKPKMTKMKFRAANGTEIKYHGMKNIRFQTEGGGGECSMDFHVTDCTRPLASAMAITRMGNRVVMESGTGKSYIENVRTGQKIFLKESGGTYVFDTECSVGSVLPVFSRRE